MKKLSILALIALMLCTMIVPAYADELSDPNFEGNVAVYSGRTLDGVWVFNRSDLDFSMDLYTTESVNFISNDQNFTYIYFDKIGFRLGYNGSVTGFIYTNASGWTDENWRTVDFGEGATVSDALYQFVTTNAVQYRECDGSTCPATDRNFNDFCDDCGMPLAYNLRVTPETVSIVVEHPDVTLRFDFVETVGGTVFEALYDDNRITVSFDNPVNHYQYKLVDGEWVDYASHPNIYGYHAISLPDDSSIISSDLDVYDSNGDLFFQNPLWMTIRDLAQGVTEMEIRDLANPLLILTVCGISLLASVILFSKFSKILSYFLS